MKVVRVVRAGLLVDRQALVVFDLHDGARREDVHGPAVLALLEEVVRLRPVALALTT